MLMVSSPLPVVMLAEVAARLPERSIVLPAGSVPSMATVVDAETVLDADSVTFPTASVVDAETVLDVDSVTFPPHRASPSRRCSGPGRRWRP